MADKNVIATQHSTEAKHELTLLNSFCYIKTVGVMQLCRWMKGLIERHAELRGRGKVLLASSNWLPELSEFSSQDSKRLCLGLINVDKYNGFRVRWISNQA